MYVYLTKWEVTECGDVKARNPPPHIETHNYSIGDGDDREHCTLP